MYQPAKENFVGIVLREESEPPGMPRMFAWLGQAAARHAPLRHARKRMDCGVVLAVVIAPGELEQPEPLVEYFDSSESPEGVGIVEELPVLVAARHAAEFSEVAVAVEIAVKRSLHQQQLVGAKLSSAPVRANL